MGIKKIKRKIKNKFNLFILGRIIKEILSMESLQGYKTYIIAIAIGVVTIIHHLGYIDAATFATLLGLLNAGGLGSLRAAK
jgi:hypothetical protein